MAIHINSVAGSGIRTVDKQGFYRELEWGDLIFCCGMEPVSKGIEQVTHSPFSHVLMVWLPSGATQWLTLESTFNKGVHVGKLSDYVDTYDGDLVMARRPALTASEKMAALNAGFNVLEDAYDWQQEVAIVAHKLVKAFPVQKPKKEYYCSGLQWLMSTATPYPLQMPGPNLPTPEDNWTDPSVIPICAMRNPAQFWEANRDRDKAA
jgi:hypothetical protein